MHKASLAADHYDIRDPKAVQDFLAEHPLVVEAIAHAEVAIRAVFGEQLDGIVLSVKKLDDQFLEIAARTSLDVDTAIARLNELDREWIDRNPLFDQEDVLITLEMA